MKRLLDRVLSRWYTPNAFYDVMNEAYWKLAEQQTMTAREYVQLKPGCYWPVPETQSVVARGMRCS